MKNLKDVKLFLLDMDGTIYLGNEKIEGAFETVENLRNMGKKICFLTNNSSKSQKVYIEKLNKMGLKISKDEMYTSGMATAQFLKKNYPNKKIYLLGTDALYDELKKNDIQLSKDNAEVVVVGFDTTLTYDKLYKCCLYLMDNVPYIATHPDYVCPAPLGDMPDVGSFMDMIYSATKKRPNYICGKPYEIMGSCIKDKFGFKNNEIAMIGDRLYTDIKFGVNNDFLSTLVLSGETTKAMYDKSDINADLVLNSLKDINKLF